MFVIVGKGRCCHCSPCRPASNGTVIVTSEPYNGLDRRRVATKPGIDVFVGCARLPCKLYAFDTCIAPGTALDDIFKNARHQICLLRGGEVGDLLGSGLINDRALFGDNLADQARLDHVSLV